MDGLKTITALSHQTKETRAALATDQATLSDSELCEYKAFYPWSYDCATLTDGAAWKPTIPINPVCAEANDIAWKPPSSRASNAIWSTLTSAEQDCKHSKIIAEEVIRAGFVIAGGAVCDLLVRSAAPKTIRGRIWHDVDVFAPGIAPDKAEAKFFALCDNLRALLKLDLKVYRTHNCITITARAGTDADVEIQLITRKYCSVAEIVYSFDLAPCAVAWDGNEVFMTPEAVFAHVTGVFMPDLSMRRVSFEKRICKYFNKGFSAALPGLKVSANNNAHTFDHPFLVGEMGLPGDVKNRLVCAWLTPRHPVEGFREYGALPYRNEHMIKKHNYEQLTGDRPYLVWERVGAPGQPHAWVVILGDLMLEISKKLFNAQNTPSTTLAAVKEIIHLQSAQAISAEAAVLAAKLSLTAGTRDSLNQLWWESLSQLWRELDAFVATIHSRAQAKQNFEWKAGAVGTEEDAEPIFAMAPISESAWYGTL